MTVSVSVTRKKNSSDFTYRDTRFDISKQNDNLTAVEGINHRVSSGCVLKGGSLYDRVAKNNKHHIPERLTWT